MLFKKQQILSSVTFIGLLSVIIALTPINAFAESPDFVTNTEVESTGGDLDEIQDGSTDEIQDEDTD